jgi:hypothetical protein
MINNRLTNYQDRFISELTKQIIATLTELGIIQTAQQSSVKLEEWLDIDALCSYLPDKPCRNTIYKWKKKGIIPYHKRSKQLYFLKSEIDSWLKSKRGKTIDEMKSIVDNKLKSSSFGRVR